MERCLLALRFIEERPWPNREVALAQESQQNHIVDDYRNGDNELNAQSWIILISTVLLPLLALVGCNNAPSTATALSEQPTPVEPTATPMSSPTPIETILTSTPAESEASPSPPVEQPTPSPTPISQPLDYGEVPMVEVPAGEFIMGLTLDQATALDERSSEEYLRIYQSARSFTDFDASIPQMKVYLDSFKIDMLEVTRSQYAACISLGHCSGSRLIQDQIDRNEVNAPIRVTQPQAQTYCQGLGKRLPTEAEWEKAARGTDGRLFPWGDEWGEDQVALATGPVNSHPDDVSPYGVLDMAGNANEWTLSPNQAYPGHPNPALFSSEAWVVRGELIFDASVWAGAVTAWREGREATRNVAGFRCVQGGEPVPVAEAVVEYQPAVPLPPPTATAVNLGEMVEIPTGPFLRGVEDKVLATEEGRYAYQDAAPQQSVYLDRYFIDRFPITTAQYAEFLNALGQHRWACSGWHCANSIDFLIYENHHYQAHKNTANLPLPFVTWYGAEAYCAWRGKRLPTEAEWEKGARGTDGRWYPWGNEWDPRATTDSFDYSKYPVGTKPYLASPYSVQDLIGTTSTGEWVNDWYAADYYARPDSLDNPQGPAEGEQKITRGTDSGNHPGIVLRVEVLPVGSGTFRCAYTPSKNR